MVKIHFKPFFVLFFTLSLISVQYLFGDDSTPRTKARVSVSTMDAADTYENSDSSKTESSIAGSIPDSMKTTSPDVSVKSPHLYITSIPQGALVTMNDKQIGKTPLASQPDQGSFKIGFSYPGYHSYITDVTVTQQLNDTLSVNLLQKKKNIQTTEIGTSGNRRILRYTLGGIGVVSVLTSIVALVNTRNSFDTLHDERNDPEKYDTNKDDYQGHLNLFTASSTVALLSGTGVVLTFLF